MATESGTSEARPLDYCPQEEQSELGEHEMACPVCGASMPDLKGGKSTICPICGFKDSCCY